MQHIHFILRFRQMFHRLSTITTLTRVHVIVSPRKYDLLENEEIFKKIQYFLNMQQSHWRTCVYNNSHLLHATESDLPYSQQ